MLYNIICVSCGCIGHDRSDYTLISVLDQRLSCLKVEPRGLVLYDFSCRISALDEQNIMIDPHGIQQGWTTSVRSDRFWTDFGPTRRPVFRNTNIFWNLNWWLRAAM